MQPFIVTSKGTVHQPLGKPLGTVICVHSIFQSEETRWPAAQAMARAGLIAINLNLPTNGTFTEYTKHLEDLISESQEPVYLWGQSMGADLVASCNNQKIQGIVTVGFPSHQPQKNELNLVGAWDELHTLDEFQSSARTLLFSNHDGENFDLQGFSLAAGHFGGRKLTSWDPFWGRALLVFGILLLCANVKLWTPNQPSSLRFVGPGLLSLAALVSWQLDPCQSLARALLAGVVLQNGRTALLPGKVLGAICAALAAGMLVNSAPNWLKEPWLLTTLPVALLCQLATGWLTITSNLNGLTCIGLTALETAFPGRLLAALLYLPNILWNGAPKLIFRVGKVSPMQGLVLISVLGIAFFEWSKVSAVGYAPDTSQLLSLSRHLAALILVPLIVFLGLARRSNQHSLDSSNS